MDWSHISLDELFSALQEEDWKQRPRSLVEFMGQFGTPRNKQKWHSRLKCNVYYYHTNYAILCTLSLLGLQYNRPLALLGALLWCAALLCMNNSLAASIDTAAINVLRLANPKLANRLKGSAHVSLGPPGRDGRNKIKILGVKRALAVLVGVVLGLVLVYKGRGVLRLLMGILLGAGLVLLHASFRLPNLKARLTNARDEFRAMWRNQQFHDYTL